eukprot:XP_012810654.1 PREDICTED: coiled-coil domain-containing protein 27-like [Xenopus tropicalis]
MDELDTVKKDYEMAKGANMSLQKLLSHQESQLRKALDEQEIFRKEAKEREMQLQAMSLKVLKGKYSFLYFCRCSLLVNL